MWRNYICITVLVLILFTGCTPTPETNPTAAIDDDYVPVVSVTGKLLPVTWANVSAQTGGVVVDILVSDGDSVTAGDMLVKIDDQDAVNTLKQANSSLTVAKTQLTQAQSGPKDEEIAVAEAQVLAARTAISQTTAQRELLNAGGYSVQLAATQAQVEAFKAERFVANQQHEDSMKCYDVRQPDGTTEHHCPTLGTIEEQTRMALHAADAALQSAETQLDMLYSEHRAQIKIADAGVLAAQKQADVAQAQLDLVQAAVSPEALAVAEAVVEQAQVAVDMAQLALERTVIRAPFSGVIGNVSIREGEYIAPGIPLLIIGDLGSLRVETTDLDEIDVAQIDLNQNAVITFEALPDETFIGMVDYIASMASSGGGGVNYTVYLSLDRIHQKLRWGMTAFVDIEAQD